MTNFEVGDKVRIAAHSGYRSFNTGMAGMLGTIEKISEVKDGNDFHQLCKVVTPTSEDAFWGYELAGVK